MKQPHNIFDTQRQHYLTERFEILKALIPRLDWSGEQLAAERQVRLRMLIAHAKTHSPWHKGRLGHIDPNSMTEIDLERVPTMSKADLAEHFDSIVTDTTLTRRRVAEHLAGPIDNPYIDGRYIATTSGGTTGTPALYVFDRRAFAISNSLIARWRIRNNGPSVRSTLKPGVAFLYAEKGTHVSQISRIVFANEPEHHHVSVTQPIGDIVATLNAVQPLVMSGYTSIFGVLAHEQAAGRLRIAPLEILASGECLSAAQRTFITRELLARQSGRLLDIWGMTEGLFSTPCHAQDLPHLPDDLTIVEPIYGDLDPQRTGVCDHILLTNLYNFALPLIRFRINDQIRITNAPCPCGSHHRRLGAIDGRNEDEFIYGPRVRIVCGALLAPLQQIEGVKLFQVQQTERGAHVLYVEAAPVDPERVRMATHRVLAECGLVNPVVSTNKVDNIDRTQSGKHRQIVAKPGMGISDIDAGVR